MVATLLTAVLVSGAAPAVAATPVSPPQVRQESYEVFIAPPSATIGSIEQTIAYRTADGSSRERSLPDNLGEPILIDERFAVIGGASHAAVEGFVLTSGAVSAISLNGGPPIPTLPAVGAPYGFRSVLYEVPGAKLSEFRAAPGVRRRSLTVTALGANGQPVTGAAPPVTPPASPALESRSWETPARPALGVCKIAASRFAGLTAESGSVVSILRPLVGAIGRPFVTCATTRYTYRFSAADESSLTSFMVLDATHPGVTPAAMPAMEPVAGHPGVYQSRVPSNALVARRVPGAWLLVQEGRDLQQRLSLLANLQASVQLHPKASHRKTAKKRR